MFDVASLLSAIDPDEARSATPQQQTPEQALERPVNQALLIEQGFGAAILATIGSKSLGQLVKSPGYGEYRRRLLESYGSPKDPLEIMLIDALAWGYLQLGLLHARAAAATSPELVDSYNAAVVRLMAEQRKTTLALREYRSPIAPKITVVRQQNFAGGDQQIAMIEGGAGVAVPGKMPADTELTSKQECLAHVEPSPPLTAADCGQAEPLEAKRPDPRRSATVA
jgi:hypothetical protein